MKKNLKLLLVLLFSPLLLMAQDQINMKGRILDVSEVPIIGANVIEVGDRQNGTISDIDGNFTLNVLETDSVQISYIGYLDQTIKATSTPVEIILEEDIQSLDEVIITGFGLAQRKESLTSAISVIGSKDLSRSKSSTASGALVGK